MLLGQLDIDMWRSEEEPLPNFIYVSYKDELKIDIKLSIKGKAWNS